MSQALKKTALKKKKRGRGGRWNKTGAGQENRMQMASKKVVFWTGKTENCNNKKNKKHT